jgi:hypothetical protein
VARDKLLAVANREPTHPPYFLLEEVLGVVEQGVSRQGRTASEAMPQLLFLLRAIMT